MKTLLLAAALTLISTAARACTLSDSDYRTLAASPSQLTPQKFSDLSPAAKKAVCDTRAFIKLVDSNGGNINQIGNYSTKYLAPDENDRVIEATNDYLSRVLANKGIGSAAG